jgi:methenyltetrahydromethanopterin cyclohydrolase
MPRSLNEQALRLLNDLGSGSDNTLGVVRHELSNGAAVFDFGVEATGSLAAGILLSRICMADCGRVSIVPGSAFSAGWPTIQVETDQPVAACLQSQYAGWKISVGDYFAMGSGPMRAAAASEELFTQLPVDETTQRVVGVLETSQLPTDDVAAYVADRCQVTPADVTLLAAPTSSLAGTIQVVARSVETSLHKLFELGFDVRRVRHGFGTAPLPPVAADDLSGIGRTNDAILYGGQVTLWVTGDDASLEEIGPRVPASAADGYGKPFLEIFRAADHDFYKIDPLLFSPAQVVFHNIETGHAFRFGKVDPSILGQSFGV